MIEINLNRSPLEWILMGWTLGMGTALLIDLIVKLQSLKRRKKGKKEQGTISYQRHLQDEGIGDN